MNQAVIHFHPSGPLLALVGNPNCGKTALFNLLTGSRQKVANYAGVTVERKEGRFVSPTGRTWRWRWQGRSSRGGKASARSSPASTREAGQALRS